MKTCTACRLPKPLDDFHRHPLTRDGRRPECKDCRRDRKRRAEPITETGKMLSIADSDAAMSYDEIAAELGISHALVGHIITTALKKLRKRHPEIVEYLDTGTGGRR